VRYRAMADLRGALLAAAEEAEKMQLDFQNQIDNLISHIDYIECENIKLRTKISRSADLVRQLADILSEDQNY
jgi:hypothetical protein